MIRVSEKLINTYIKIFNWDDPVFFEVKNDRLSKFNIFNHFDSPKNLDDLNSVVEPKTLVLKIPGSFSKHNVKEYVLPILESNIHKFPNLIILGNSERTNLKFYFKSSKGKLSKWESKYTRRIAKSLHGIINIKHKDFISSVMFLSNRVKGNCFVCEIDEDYKSEELSNSLNDFKKNDTEIIHDDFQGDYLFIDYSFNFLKHRALKKISSLKEFYKDALKYEFRDLFDESKQFTKAIKHITDEVIDEWSTLIKKNKNRFLIIPRNSEQAAHCQYPSIERPVDKKFIKDNLLYIIKKDFDRVVIMNYLNSDLGLAVKNAFGSLKRKTSGSEVTEFSYLSSEGILSMPVLILSPKKTYEFSFKDSLEKIEGYISVIIKDLSENHNVDSNAKKLQALLSAINLITPEEEAMERLSKEEDISLEFKSGYSMGDDQKKNNDLSIKIFQTICAFTNTQGGHIYCGIRDSGELLGIDRELKLFFNDSVDNLCLDFFQKLEKYIGKSHMSFVSASVLNIKSHKIFEIAVKPSYGYGSYFLKNENELITRLGNRNLKLHGTEIIRYITSRETADHKS